MTTTRHIPDKAQSGLSVALRRIDKRLPPKAFFLLCAAIMLLAALAAVNISKPQALLTEGDIAPADIIADSTFLIKDGQATAARQDVARRMQPLVLDLTPMSVDVMHERVQRLFLKVNEAHTAQQLEEARKALSEDLGRELSHAEIVVLAAPVVQNAVLTIILPAAEQQLRAGVVSDPSLVRSYPGGVVIRNLASGEEIFNTEAYGLPNLTTLQLHLSQQIKDLSLSVQAKQAITKLMESLVRPTLLPNYEATQVRAESAAQTVDPVFYRVLKGEMIMQQGDRVSREQQLKMQIMLKRQGEPFQTKVFFGIFLCGLLIASGLLFSPSGRPGSTVANKDFVFLSVLLVIFALMAKGFAAHGEQIASVTVKFLPESLAYALPVAGAAALSAQIFTARRYLVTGLLLSFFCTVMMGGGLPLFLYYFLASMWSTWLTNRSASRRDVVWSAIPMTLGLLAMWAGATLIQGGAHNRYLSEMIAVAGGGFLSMALTFALSPVVEMAFGYTTRFRLMELLNLEQPLLRDLMLKAPGTYHHSLIVSNMCEAGAKRVGAHGLLCKVAALYHDIGKVTKAGYFIENQPSTDNPHDRLAPSMSALILISHVKQGVELAKEHRLGKEVTDIIAQHHGTSIIQYFYRKALNMTDAVPPNIEDFRYPGPKPQTREAALVMLADIVEASSRTLDDPTPTRLFQHTDTIMKSIYAAGQLDDSELTFRDLTNLADSFQQVLRGLYHHRISYPGQEKLKQAKPLSLKPAESAAYGGVPGENPSAPPAPAPEGETKQREQNQNDGLTTQAEGSSVRQ